MSILFEAAAAGTDGPVTLFQGKRSWASSLRADWGAGSSRQIVVEGKTLDTIMRHLGLASVDLIKIDVEGVEVDVLRSANSLGTCSSVIIGEIHDLLPGWRTEATALEEFLTSCGFAWESHRYRTDQVFRAMAGASAQSDLLDEDSVHRSA